MYRLKRTAILLIGCALVFAGVSSFLRKYKQWQVTDEWSQTLGTVEAFQLRPTGTIRNVHLQIAFRYSVDNRDYVGHRIYPHDDSEVSRLAGLALQKQYRVGSQVAVFYSPQDPHESCLELPGLWWEVVLLPAALASLGLWILFLLWKTRLQKIPSHVLEVFERELSEPAQWTAVFSSVINREYIVLRGKAWFARTDGVLTSWPGCRVALIASPNGFAVTRGPYTGNGTVSAVLTLVLEAAVSCLLLPLFHGLAFLREAFQRKKSWRLLNQEQYQRLFESSADNVQVVSIDDASVYGYDPSARRLWFRLPERPIDDYIILGANQQREVDEFIAFVRLMQNANIDRA